MYLSVFGITLCACCSSASPLEIQTGIFCKSVTLWTALQIPLWSKPHLVFQHKVYEIAHSEAVLATQMGVTEVQHRGQLIWIVQFDPFSPHSGSIPQELVHSYALGCLWVVTVYCNTVGRHGRAFCRPNAYTFNEQSKMATALTPQTDITSEKVTWLMENPRQQSRPAYRK